MERLTEPKTIVLNLGDEPRERVPEMRLLSTQRECCHSN
jgi:hypothetical protein